MRFGVEEKERRVAREREHLFQEIISKRPTLLDERRKGPALSVHLKIRTTYRRTRSWSSWSCSAHEACVRNSRDLPARFGLVLPSNIGFS